MQAGDRVAYSAAFLKSTGQFTGSAPQRRGTYVGPAPGPEKTHSRVRWDSFDFAHAARQNGEDYAEHVREHGELAATKNIAKVGSARFALNDL